MAVDKNKIIAEATKLVQKGAFDKAIKQYERILAEDPKDVRVLLKVGELEMNLISREVRRAGQSVDLQPREFRLLEYLMRNRDQVVTRTMLLENVWDYHFDPQTNVIDVHISRLRRKIDKDFEPPLIHTVRGAGYKLSESP